MAIILADRYPGRAGGKTLDYPQGSFKNRTSPTAKDGTYLEQDWANDMLAFFQSLIKDSGLVPNGVVDTVQASQYFDALMLAVGNRFAPLMTFAEVDALVADQGPIICTDQDGILYAWDAGTSKYVAQTADDATALAKSSKVNLLTPAGLGFSLQPSITGSATFTKLTNNIQLTDIRDELALEVGDVIQISGSTSNDNLYTVESITDADNLIVNYEHRNGAGSLSLADETETVTVKRIAKWFSAPIGLGQAWVNVFSKRTTNTAYINSTGRSIQIDYALSTGGATAQISSAGGGGSWIKCAETGTGGFSVQMVIPSGWAYKFSSLSNNNIGLELR